MVRNFRKSFSHLISCDYLLMVGRGKNQCANFLIMCILLKPKKKKVDLHHLAAQPIITLKSDDYSYAMDFMLVICSDKCLTRIDYDPHVGREGSARALTASHHHGELPRVLLHLLTSYRDSPHLRFSL